jgi:alkylation response protein AidB-like acyl-CoA dehydrogenase
MITNVSDKQAREVVEPERKLPSFGKQLFLGEFRLELIHPQPRSDPEEVEKGERFLERLRELLETEVDPLEIERDAKIPDRAVDGLKAIGALGMKVKEQYGGLGLSQVYYNRAIGLAASWHPSVALLLSAHQSIGVAEPLRLFGSDEQKRTWLPLVAKDHISAFLLTEPEVGSDPARMGAVARPVYDDIVATPVEGGYRLSGRKLWATNGTIADITVVMAKVPESEGHRGGISAFVMPYHSEGVTVEHRNAFMGLHGIENSVTLLDNVFVPEENRIAREGDGLKIALSTLNTGRLGVMASAVGTAKWCTKIAREWAVERAQWGRSIGKHDAVAQMVAFIAGSAFGMEAMLDVVGRLADNKANDVRTEAAMCKVYGAELGWRVIDTLVQLRGGRGYETAASLKARGEKPVPVEQVMRDFRVNRIFEGSSEIMHLMVAREGVEALLKETSALLEPDGDVKTMVKDALAGGLPSLAVDEGERPRSFHEFGELALYLCYVEDSSRRVARSILEGAGRWEAKLQQKQSFLARIVDIGAELFAIAAAVCYAETIGSEHPERKTEAVELAQLFCEQAKGRAETLFNELWSNHDDGNYAAAQEVLAGRYTWLEDGIADPSGDGPMMAPLIEP